MGQRMTGWVKLLDAAVATGKSANLNVAGRRHVLLVLAASGTVDLTVKVRGALLPGQDPATDTPTATNAWDYIALVNYQTGDEVDGDTGAVMSSAVIEQYFLNLDYVDTIALELTRTNGTLTAWACGVGE
jgi:hypothetical protein